MNEGQRIMEAWRQWIATDEGDACAAGPVSNPYLRNRLERAFQQGWAAGRADAAITPNDEGPLT